MLKVTEDKWSVETLVLPGGQKAIDVTVTDTLTQFEALRLAKALEMASDHLATT